MQLCVFPSQLLNNRPARPSTNYACAGLQARTTSRVCSHVGTHEKQRFRRFSCCATAGAAALAPKPSALQDSIAQTSEAEVKKSRLVKGTIVSVDETAATVLLSSGSSAVLSQQNLTLLQGPAIAVSQVLRPGDEIWAVVLREPDASEPHVRLSTAALEMRPGDMLVRRQQLFSDLHSLNMLGASLYDVHTARAPGELAQLLAPLQAPGARALAREAELRRKKEQRLAARLRERAMIKPPRTGAILTGRVTLVKPVGATFLLPGGFFGFLPISQVRAGSFVEVEEMQRLLTRGDEVVVFVKRVEEKGQEQGEAGGSSGPASYPQQRLNITLSISNLELELGQAGLFSSNALEYNTKARALQASEEMRALRGRLSKVAGLLQEYRSAVEQQAQREGQQEAGGEALPAKGTMVRGVVHRTEKYGVFVQLEGGATGMIHISQVSTLRVTHLDQLFKAGDEVHAVLLRADDKIALSLKAVEEALGMQGVVLRDIAGFRAAAAGQYAKQREGAGAEGEQQQAPQPLALPQRVRTQPLLVAAKLLAGAPWSRLAAWPGPEAESLAAEYQGACQELEELVVGRVPPALRHHLSRSSSSSNSSSGGEADQQQQHAVGGDEGGGSGVLDDLPDSLRNAWLNMRQDARKLAVVMCLVQVQRAAAAAGAPAVAVGAKEELGAAAEGAVVVARLLGSKALLQASSLVASVEAALGAVQVPFTQGALSGLAAWGWSLVERQGGAALADSGVVDLLARAGYKPPRKWARKVISALQKGSLGRSAESSRRLFELMAAFGVTPYWPNTLRTLYAKLPPEEDAVERFMMLQAMQAVAGGQQQQQQQQQGEQGQQQGEQVQGKQGRKEPRRQQQRQQ